ncbi:MAG: hypothetical protein DWQ01_14775 [Planctomycetota bacterium]|nr:MAG: hypothetical protein DWQ01_14775 [Planctomycetota bacterium]
MALSFLLLSAALVWLPQTGSEPQREAVDRQRMRATLEKLCSFNRLAGSPESAEAAQWAAEQFEAMGFRVERPRFEVFMPRQKAASLEWQSPGGPWNSISLNESGDARYPQSLEPQAPPMHGLTRAGTVEGPLVYAGRGSREEFEKLQQSLGSDLTGRIALVRYGGSYRGDKVYEAAQAGCAGALLYSDPEDDGRLRGPVLPDGPWRPASGIQRGSVYRGLGDPLTPGWASIEGAKRLPLSQARGLAPIPSLPVSAATAELLFGAAGRPESPSALSGKVRLTIDQDPSPVWIENTLAWMEGSQRPEEWVIFGGHRDAWGFGAVDNGTGITVLMELAAILAEAAQQGWKPQRSLAIALWDGEEWGMTGSTEWVEGNLDSLTASAVAYINLDAIISGSRFGSYGTPGMTSVMKEAAAAVGLPVPDQLSIPGGGSDHAPFLEFAGVEVAGFGFYGGHGTYHSHWDLTAVLVEYLDPEFEYHQKAAAFTVELAKRLTKKDTRVDGVESWCREIRKAAAGFKPVHPEVAKLQNAAIDLHESSLALKEPPPYPHRFLRLFLPVRPGGRLSIRNSTGYAARWFPEVQDQWPNGPDLGPALQRARQSLEQARRVLIAATKP